MGTRLINLVENQLDYELHILQGLKWDVPKSQFSAKLKATKEYVLYCQRISNYCKENRNDPVISKVESEHSSLPTPNPVSKR